MIKRCIYCQSRVNVEEHVIDCPKCGLDNKLTPFVDTPMLNATTFRVFDAFESPATGKIITNERERQRDMKESGCREWQGMDDERKEAERRKKYDDEKLESQIDDTFDEIYYKTVESATESLTNI